MSYSAANIVGNLGRDPEIKHLPSGKAVASFSVAVNDGTREKEHTSWVDCTAWDKTAERMAEMHKGDCVAVLGRLRQETWVTQAGERRSRLGLVAVVVYQVAKGERRAADGDQDVQPEPAPAATAAEIDGPPSDGLPF
jgi:single-strand DNA-binding protein